ncbi:uncharacterized protein [Panulirus ornatus]|uniref:uncharacterized protein n=1 Tax=Panulirus ornatus TaxID=150431 RepID=UPI003A8C163A
MNSVTVLSIAALAACASAQPLGYFGVYGGYPGTWGAYPGLWNAAAPVTLKTVASEPITIEAAAPTPLAYNVAPFAPAAPVQSRFHAQDEFGQYSFGFNGGFNSRNEMRDAFGNVRGSYNYLDSNGKVQTQHYVADALGFRVSGTNLPEATAPAVPEYTQEVATVRAAHLALHEAVDASAALPEPEYTEEVAAARAEHLTAHEEAAAASAALSEPENTEEVAVAEAEPLTAQVEAVAAPAAVAEPEYTPEVASLRAVHQAAHDEATAAAAAAAAAQDPSA